MAENSNNTENCAIACDRECKEHSNNTTRINVLESKFTVIEQNTNTVNKLTTKVSLLLTIMSFVVLIVSGAAIYTFTGLSTFKDTYANDRVEIIEKISNIQEKNAETIRTSIARLEKTIDNRLDYIEDNLDKLDRKIETISTNTQ